MTIVSKNHILLVRCMVLYFHTCVVYSYDGMDEETWGESEEEGERGDTVSEAELEKLLLKGMSDSGSEPEEEEEENDSAGKKKKQNK